MNLRLLGFVSALGMLSPIPVLAAEPADAGSDDVGPSVSDRPAEPKTNPETERPKYKTYKEQVVIADVTSLGLGLTTAVLSDGDSDALRLALGFTALWFVASPVIHAVHGRPLAAVASLAMRTIGVPVVTMAGIALGSALCDGQTYGCVVSIGLFGGLALIGGIAATTALDAEYLAKEEVRRPTSASVRVLPSVDPLTRSVSLGAGVTF
jgi:hypothetical protein